MTQTIKNKRILGIKKSNLGYLYQVRSALLSALQRTRTYEEFLIRFKALDDVVFREEEGGETLIQAKLRCERPADLTDTSPDLWQELRIWYEGAATGEISIYSSLYLMTASTASDGTAASYLRIEGRDPHKALDRLRLTARNFGDETNPDCYRVMRKGTYHQQCKILQRVYVLDAAPLISLDDELQKELYGVAKREHLKTVLERLEDWWFSRAIRQLSDPGTDEVYSQKFSMQIGELREQSWAEPLPN